MNPFWIIYMHNTEYMIAIYVPESLIVGLREFVGPVYLNMNRLRVEDGFALSPDEFVTSLRLQREAERLAGFSRSSDAIITNCVFR
ncbi:hypothetical protein ACR9GP_25860 [Enterobacter ludwigii]